MHVFKHPKYYEEMRQRAKKFQREEKLKQQASSHKQQALLYFFPHKVLEAWNRHQELR